MARPAHRPPNVPGVVLINADEDCSATSFASFVRELLAEPESGIESLRAVEALRVLRSDATG